MKDSGEASAEQSKVDSGEASAEQREVVEESIFNQ